MRWMIVVLVIALALIMDQLKFSGYYRDEVVSAANKGAARITQLFR